MTKPLKLPLSDEDRARLEELAKREADHIRKIADGLKGEARDKYLIALAARRQ